jgi:hypothetical protein
MKLRGSRWMGIAGVAAISATAGGFGLVQASTGSGNVMTAITPCRLVDTRAGSAIGPRSTPLGAGETVSFAAIGNNGQCTGIDLGAQAIEVQLTSTGATRDSYLTVFPSNLSSPPNVSHLNPQVGIDVVSNTTTATLSPDGRFSVFNELGTTDIVIDVLGVYVPGGAGADGADGADGATGPVGPQGPAGATGATGAPGPQGDAGPQGVPGVKGDPGDTGPQGEVGPQGDAGPQGVPGVKGDPGDTGPQGEVGPQGDAGPQGVPGVKGDPGDTGPQGDAGPQGVPGVKGDPGDTGPQGDAGPQGVPGVKGDPGDTGPQGDAGPQGEVGPQGEAGPQGVPGPQGASGLTDVTVVTSAVVGPNGGSKTATATCTSGVAISGGFVISGNVTSIKESRPSDDGTGWTVVTNTPEIGNSSLQVYAICATVAST